MALSKKDKQFVGEMIARAIRATTTVDSQLGGAKFPVVDSEVVETAAQEPESGVMGGVETIEIGTALKGVAGVPQPGAGIGEWATIRGTVNGQTTSKMFGFPPGDQAHLSELKRLQNYPHLLQGLYFSFREPASGDKYITTIYVHYDKSSQ